MATLAASVPLESGPPPFADAAELEALTRPVGEPRMSRVPLTAHRLDRDEPKLTQEALVFPSAIQLAHPETNLARAYVYRLGPLGERPVILWVPGQFVSDVAFLFIDRFLDLALERGCDVVLYVPPYHLERTPRGAESGDTVLATTFADHLGVFAQGLSDLRTLTRWLRAQGVTQLGAFGGSLGASLLLRESTWEQPFEFMTLLIPILHWREVLNLPELAEVRARLLDLGYDEAAWGRFYDALDATGAPLALPAPRVAVLYGRFDRIASADAIEAWARAVGVKRLHAFNRGHGLALVTPALYDTYADLLDQDLDALTQRGE